MQSTRLNVNAKYFLGLLLCLAQSPAVGQQSHPKPAVTKSRNAPAVASRPAPEESVPFAVGETLQYQVLWTKYQVHAATLEFSVVEKRNFFGRPAWHFLLRAHTINTMRTVYPLDDQFDSYTDASQLVSLQYELHLRELGTPQNSVYRMSTGPEPVPPDASLARVLPGTRDAVGILYALRAVDWNHTPEFRSPVFDGRKLYDVHARLDANNETVQVPAGRFTASRIGVYVFENGKQDQNINFNVWLANDAARTPLLIQAVAPIGNARVELLSLPRH